MRSRRCEGGDPRRAGAATAGRVLRAGQFHFRPAARAQPAGGGDPGGPGVAGVYVHPFRVRGRSAGLVEMRDMVAVGSDQIIRCDNDPSRPETRRAPVTVGRRPMSCCDASRRSARAHVRASAGDLQPAGLARSPTESAITRHSAHALLQALPDETELTQTIDGRTGLAAGRRGRPGRADGGVVGVPGRRSHLLQRADRQRRLISARPTCRRASAG